MSKTRSPQSTPRSKPAAALRSASLALYERNYFFASRAARRFLPHGRYLGAFAIAAAVMSADPARPFMRYLFAFTWGLFLAGFFFNWLSRPRGLVFSRQLPPRALEGERFSYSIRVTNQSSRATPAVEARDCGKINFPSEREWARRDPPFHLSLNRFDRWAGYPKWLWLVERNQDALCSDFLIPPLAPGESVLIPATAICHGRGERLFLGFYCGVSDPLGLMRRLFYVERKQTLIVLPSPKPCPISIPSGSRSERRGDSRSLARAGDSEEFRSLRQWRSGDPLKRIDWKATARLGEPVTREFSPEFFRRSAIALDTYLPAEADSEIFEEALRRCSGLLLSSDRKEAMIDLLFVDQSVFELPLARGKSDHLKALERVAVSQPSSTDRIEELEATLLSQAKAFSSVALICGVWDASRSAMVERLQRKGVSVAVVVCSELLERDASSPRPDVSSAKATA